MAINTIKTLTLELDGSQVECQLTKAALVDDPDTEELTSFCGTETSATANYNLSLSGFQDYGQAESVFDLIHEAYVAEPTGEIDFVLVVGSKTRTGTCRPVQDSDFGGDAGAALTADVELDVIGVPTDGTVTTP
jgi:hypothetical protein